MGRTQEPRQARVARSFGGARLATVSVITVLNVVACQREREAESPPVRVPAEHEVEKAPAPAEFTPVPVQDVVDVCAPGSRCIMVGVHLDPLATADRLDQLSHVVLRRAEEIAPVSEEAATDMVADAMGLQALARKLRDFPDYARQMVRGAEYESLGNAMQCAVEQLARAEAPEELTCWPGRVLEVDATIEKLLMEKAEREMMTE